MLHHNTVQHRAQLPIIMNIRFCQLPAKSNSQRYTFDVCVMNVDVSLRRNYRSVQQAAAAAEGDKTQR